MRTTRKAAILLAAAVVLPARADDRPVVTHPYAPRLADIMGATQLRHFKLWYAGTEKNWPLATYELGQIRESFGEAMTYYPGLPISDMTTLSKPSAAIEAAIKAKDSARFAVAFRDLTAGCNDCHRAQGMGFIAIKVPNASPFSNQIFAPNPPAHNAN
jgi:hypothetical protein